MRPVHRYIRCDSLNEVILAAGPIPRNMAREKTFFDRVINSIERVRKPGESPQESLHSFDEFECKGFIVRRELTQCHYCGRWVCKSDCWNEEILSCTSCASVIKLGKELALREGANGETENEEVKEEEKSDGDGVLRTLGGKIRNNLPGLGDHDK